MQNEASDITILSSQDGEMINATVTISSISHCLRELIENSLDAGSSIISISITNCGLESIVVSDNGSGISRSNFDILCSEGATSKEFKIISQTDQRVFNSQVNSKCFTQINSKKSQVKCFSTYSGGRGRALGAILNISYLTIESSCDNSGHGYRLTFDKSGQRIIQPISRLKGTTVSVQSIFHSYPVRRHHLLQRKLDEYREIEEVIASFSMSTTASINFSIDGKTVTQVHSNKLINRIKSVLGPDVASHMIHDQVDLGEWCENSSVEVCMTPLNRNVNGRIYISINGRPTINMNIIRGIRTEFKSCNGNKWPVVCLMIRCPNRESYEFIPDSPFICTEFAKEEQLRELICSSLHAFWINGIQSSNENISNQPLSTRIMRIKPSHPKCLTNHLVHSSLTTDKIIQNVNKARNKTKVDNEYHDLFIKQSAFLKMNIIGQWNQSYILTNLGLNIFAIDQHSASLALVQSDKKRNIVKSRQTLVSPIVLKLSEEDTLVAVQFQEKLKLLGYEFDIITNESNHKNSNGTLRNNLELLIKTIPMDMSTATALNHLQDAIEMLKNDPSAFQINDGSLSRQNHQIMRAYDKLSPLMMKKLVGEIAKNEDIFGMKRKRPIWACIADL